MSTQRLRDGCDICIQSPRRGAAAIHVCSCSGQLELGGQVHDTGMGGLDTARELHVHANQCVRPRNAGQVAESRATGRMHAELHGSEDLTVPSLPPMAWKR